MDKTHQPLLWIDFVIWTSRISNNLHDQMNEDDQSPLNPIRSVFPFVSAIWDGSCFHELLEMSPASFLLLSVITIPYYNLFE